METLCLRVEKSSLNWWAGSAWKRGTSFNGPSAVSTAIIIANSKWWSFFKLMFFSPLSHINVAGLIKGVLYHQNKWSFQEGAHPAYPELIWIKRKGIQKTKTRKLILFNFPVYCQKSASHPPNMAHSDAKPTIVRFCALPTKELRPEPSASSGNKSRIYSWNPNQGTMQRENPWRDFYAIIPSATLTSSVSRLHTCPKRYGISTNVGKRQILQ